MGVGGSFNILQNIPTTAQFAGEGEGGEGVYLQTPLLSPASREGGRLHFQAGGGGGGSIQCVV